MAANPNSTLAPAAAPAAPAQPLAPPAQPAQPPVPATPAAQAAAPATPTPTTPPATTSTPPTPPQQPPPPPPPAPQPPPQQPPQPGLYLPPIPVQVQGGINVQVGGQPSQSQSAQPRKSPWWATVTIVAASLLTLFGLVWLIISKIPNKRMAEAILTPERARIEITGDFSGVNSDKELGDGLLTKIENKKTVEEIGQEVKGLKEEIAKIRATPPPPPRVIVKVVEKTIQSPAPTPSAAAATDKSFSFDWVNSRSEAMEVWIDGVLPKRVLKPGQGIRIEANTPITAWSRGVKTGQVFKYQLTKEAADASSERRLRIY